MRALICKIFGHEYKKEESNDRYVDYYVCTRCGKRTKVVRYEAWKRK